MKTLKRFKKNPLVQFVELYEHVENLIFARAYSISAVRAVTISFMFSLQEGKDTERPNDMSELIKAYKSSKMDSFIKQYLPKNFEKFPKTYDSVVKDFQDMGRTFDIGKVFEFYNTFEERRSKVLQEINNYRSNLDPDVARVAKSPLSRLEQECLKLK